MSNYTTGYVHAPDTYGHSDASVDVTPDMIRVDDRAPSYGRTASGYGAKIPTSVSVFFQNRWRRVYVTTYGNAGSAWITVDGARRYVDLY